jgi:hypothetical protein
MSKNLIEIRHLILLDYLALDQYIVCRAVAKLPSSREIKPFQRKHGELPRITEGFAVGFPCFDLVFHYGLIPMIYKCKRSVFMRSRHYS